MHNHCKRTGSWFVVRKWEVCRAQREVCHRKRGGGERGGGEKGGGEGGNHSQRGDTSAPRRPDASTLTNTSRQPHNKNSTTDPPRQQAASLRGLVGVWGGGPHTTSKCEAHRFFTYLPSMAVGCSVGCTRFFPPTDIPEKDPD